MAWPVDFSAGSDVQSFENLISFWRALRERSWAIGVEWFPARNNVQWDTGTITGATSTTITDSGKAWPAARWVDYVNEEIPWLPRNYDVILDCDNLDHSKHVRARIISHTATTLTIETIADYVTGGWIPSVASLIGKKFAIIKRNGIGWGDRWPRFPNDREAWNTARGGAVSVSIIAGSFTPAGNYVGKTFRQGATASLIREVRGDGSLVVDWLSSSVSGAYQIDDGGTTLATGSASSTVDGLWRGESDFPAGAFAGKDLLIYAGPLARISITSNTATTIQFSKQASAYNGNAFSIVAAGGKAWPGRAPDYPGRWYAGATADYYTRRPADPLFDSGVSIVRMPIASLTWEVGSPPFCVVESHDVFDVDAWSEVDEECSEPDDPKAPAFYKSLRALQVWIEENCGSFVPVDDYHGKTAIPSYTPATLFKDIGAGYVGTFTATADGDGNYTFTGIGSSESEPYHWTIINPDGSVRSSGTRSGTTFFVDDTEPGATFTLIAARGWTRKYPREFRHAYSRSGFIPDIQTTEFGSSAVDPPTNEYPGTWLDRDPSEAYAESDGLGFTQDIGPAFINGTRARYRGDNWGDPSVEPHTKTEDDSPDVRYYRDLWLGRFDVGARVAYDALKSGRCKIGGRQWFRQESADWWGFPIGAGQMIVHSGAATSGSSTTLTDNTRNWIPPEAITPEMIPFWNSAANGPRFVGFMLEITKTVNDVNGDPQTVIYRTPITGHSGYTVTFQAVPAFTIAATATTAQINAPSLTVGTGDGYAIREPYRRNWFKGRSITINKPGQTAQTRTVTHHDAEYLWFDSVLPFDIDSTCTFAIDELSPGHVYQWSASGSKWVAVAGTTHAANELLPAVVTAHGRIRKGDYLGPVYAEIYAAINKLVWTRGGTDWTSRANPAVEEKNYGYPPEPIFEVSGDGTLENWETMLGIYESYFDGVSVPVEDDGYPPSYRLFGVLRPTASELQAGNSFAYGRATVPNPGPIPLSRAVDFYALSWIRDFNPAAGTTETINESESGGITYIAHGLTTYEFDAQGTGLLYRQFAKYSTVGPTTAAIVQSSRLGNAGYVEPAYPPAPFESTFDPDTSTVESYVEQKFAGYHIAQAVTVIRWNVTGGFVYVA